MERRPRPAKPDVSIAQLQSNPISPLDIPDG
jgi:hypothetical protein